MASVVIWVDHRLANKLVRLREMNYQMISNNAKIKQMIYYVNGSIFINGKQQSTGTKRRVWYELLIYYLIITFALHNSNKTNINGYYLCWTHSIRIRLIVVYSSSNICLFAWVRIWCSCLCSKSTRLLFCPHMIIVYIIA